MKSVPSSLQANRLPTVYSRAMAYRSDRLPAVSRSWLIGAAITLADGMGTFRFRPAAKQGRTPVLCRLSRARVFPFGSNGFSKDLIFKELRIDPQSENELRLLVIKPAI